MSLQSSADADCDDKQVGERVGVCMCVCVCVCVQQSVRERDREANPAHDSFSLLLNFSNTFLHLRI